MKEIFSFTADKEKDVEVKIKTDDGVLTKVEKQKIPVKIIIKSPSVLEKEQLDEYQAVEWSKLVMAGVLTKQMLLKLYSDAGGVLSKDDITKYTKLIEDYNSTLLQFQDLSGKSKKSNKEELDAVTKELESLYQEIQNFDLAREELFRNSAESRVKDKSIQWLSVFLPYIEENGKLEPLLKGANFQEKLNSYYEIKNSEDDFLNNVFDKVAFYVSLWYLGRVTEKEDFEKLEESINGQ